MDLVSNMLSTLRLNASVFMHSTFCKEWVIDTGAFDVATFHIIAHGDCWLHIPRKDPVALHERDVVVLPHNAPHMITNSHETPRPETPRNTPPETISGPSTTLICGTAAFSQNYWNPLIEALPEYVILPTGDSRGTTLGKAIDALIHECEMNEVGKEAMVDRLADILFIEVLRSHIRKESSSPGLVAIADPKMSRVLDAIHSEPGKSWAVENLASIACMSRSAFAERFQKLLNITPMNYVTRWRMQLAHRKITGSSEPMMDIAHACGYQSEESFSKAFRKEFGASPKAVRRRETASEMAGMLSVSNGDRGSTKILYSPLELNRLRKSGAAIVIDVRDASAYSQGHIPGAVNIPGLFTTLSMTSPEGLQEMIKTFGGLLRQAGVEHGKTAIIYEDSLDTNCGSSCRGYFLLSLLGHPNPGLLDGGLDLWQSEGYPLDNQVVTPAPSDFVPSLQGAALATVDDILQALEQPDIKLLDSRDKDEWLGIISAPASAYPADFLPRKGRIPGARWVEWRRFMDSKDGVSRFKSPAQILSICAQAGLYPNDDIIVYCFKGARAANTLIALKLAGFKRVRNYFGSWNEWSRNPALPAMAVRLMA